MTARDRDAARAAEAVRPAARPLRGGTEDYDELLALIGDARSFELSDPCEGEVVAQLREQQRQRGDYTYSRDGRVAEDEYFFAERLQRAIGVIYRPQSERLSHYYEARLPEQFDALLHFDETRALEPLEPTAEWRLGEPPETYPTGI